MASQQSIQDQAFRIANSMAVEPDSAVTIDNFFLTEDAFRDALIKAVRQHRFRRSFDLTVADGVVELPDVLLLENNTISIEGDTPTSFENYMDYMAAPLSIINYASIAGNNLLYREAGGDADTFDGSIKITCVALPDIPSTITDPIDIPESLADAVSGILAEIIRGN